MLFGGPFTFLAGLFGLGAAGASYLVESAGREAENAAYRQRQREHNFAPADFQQELEQRAAFNRGYGYSHRNCMGFNLDKIREAMMKDHGPIYCTALGIQDLAACAIAKYYIEKEFGLEYDPNNSWFPLRTYHYTFMVDYFDNYTTDEFRSKDPNIEKVKTLTKEQMREEYNDVWDCCFELNAPYSIASRYKRFIDKEFDDCCYINKVPEDRFYIEEKRKLISDFSRHAINEAVARMEFNSLKQMCEEKGFTNFSETWEEFRERIIAENKK